MAIEKIQKRFFSKLFGNRKGTAEIVGSVLFLVILLFVFTNVYMWHDTASREMSGIMAEKQNTPVSIEVPENGSDLVVTNNGGFEAGLSRLWLVNVTSSDHYYVDLEPFNIRVAAGAEFQLNFTDGDIQFNLDGSVHAELKVDLDGNYYVEVFYPDDQIVVCKVLTTLGNVAACTYQGE